MRMCSACGAYMKAVTDGWICENCHTKVSIVPYSTGPNPYTLFDAPVKPKEPCIFCKNWKDMIGTYQHKDGGETAVLLDWDYCPMCGKYWR